ASVHDGRSVTDVTFSRDGKWGASASVDGTVVLFEAISGQALLTIPHEGAVTGCEFSDDSSLLVTASMDHQLRIVDLSGSNAQTLPPIVKVDFYASIVV